MLEDGTNDIGDLDTPIGVNEVSKAGRGGSLYGCGIGEKLTVTVNRLGSPCVERVKVRCGRSTTLRWLDARALSRRGCGALR